MHWPMRVPAPGIPAGPILAAILEAVYQAGKEPPRDRLIRDTTIETIRGIVHLLKNDNVQEAFLAALKDADALAIWKTAYQKACPN